MPTKVRLTTGRLADFKYEGSGAQTFLWDTEVNGLAVRATPPTPRNPNGVKAFIFQSRFNGATIRITIGDLRHWDLDKARAKARTYQTEIDGGRDPRTIKAEKTAADEAANTARKEAIEEGKRKQHHTLRAMCEAYCAGLKSKGKVNSARDALSAFRVHVFDSDYASLTANSVTSHQIADLVRKVAESGKTRTAGILRNYLVAAYNAARKAPFNTSISSELIKFDVTTNPAERISAIPVVRGERCLTAEEIKLYIEALGDTPTDLLLKAHLYTGGQRMAQLARIKVSDYNAETKTIRLLDPKGKRLIPRVHLIPLAPEGEAIIATMVKAKRDLPDAKIFGASERLAGDRVSEINKLIKIPAFDLRDLRRTCETMLVSIGIRKDIRAQLLSHGLGGVQDNIYDQHDYIDEKRQALSIWESRIREILNGETGKTSNVISFHRDKAG